MSILQFRRILRKATQAEQEAGTSSTVVVTPANQQNHPSAAKWWGYATVSAGTPTLQVSYNVTSITDTALGSLTWTIATDFSSANWSYHGAVAPNAANAFCAFGAPAAGSILQFCVNVVGPAAHDPLSWSAAGFGDQ